MSKAWSLLATSMPMLPMPIMPAFLSVRATPVGPLLPVLNVLCLGMTCLARARMRASAPSARGVGLAPEVLATRTSGLKASKGMSSTPAPVFWRSLRLDAALATSGESLVARITSASAASVAISWSSPCWGVMISISGGRRCLILLASPWLTTRTFIGVQRV